VSGAQDRSGARAGGVAGGCAGPACPADGRPGHTDAARWRVTVWRWCARRSAAAAVGGAGTAGLGGGVVVRAAVRRRRAGGRDDAVGPGCAECGSADRPSDGRRRGGRSTRAVECRGRALDRGRRPRGDRGDAPTGPQPAATDRPQPSATANGPDAAARIEVRAESWVQVIGASGRVLLQRTMQPGEVIRINEDLPLAVTIGRADATDVVVRGQPFDLGPVTRNNVARFQIR